MSPLSQHRPRPRTQVRVPAYPRTLVLGAALTALAMSTAACMGAAPSPYSHTPAAPSVTTATDPATAPTAPVSTVATDPTTTVPDDPPLAGEAPAIYEPGK